MKKGILLFSFLFIFVSSTIFATSGTGILKDGGENGYAMSLNQFNNTYGAPTKTRVAKQTLNNRVSAKINFNSINLQGNTLEIDATINNRQLIASGDLYLSEKENTIVAQLNDHNGTYDILLFEIYNNNSPDIKALTSTKTKHLKMYLADDKDIYIFEIPLPSDFSNINTNDMEKASALYDTLWFTKIIQPYEHKKIPVDEKMIDFMGVNKEIGIRGSNSFTDWAFDNIYYESWYYGSDYYQFYSLPHGKWMAGNILSSDTTWVSSFKIAEHLKINGSTHNSDNAIYYKDVAITHSVGAKTTILRAFLDGKLIENSNTIKKTGAAIALKVCEKLWSTALPMFPSLSTIKGWVDTVQNLTTSTTITLGSTNININNDVKVVEGCKTSSNYKMHSDEHYLTYQTVSKYYDTQAGTSNEGTSASANGLIRISWTKYHGLGDSEKDYIDIPISYTSYK